MDYIKADEAAAQWGISTRRLQTLCAEGKISGATRFGRAWMIPKGAQKPADGRKKAVEIQNADIPMPRKTPFLYMTDLYNTPGCAEKATEALVDNPEAQILFAAGIAYCRGQIDKVYEIASYLLQKRSGFYAVLSAGMLLAQCAIWRGDLNMWRKAKVHIAEADAQNDLDRDIISFSICAVDSMLYDVRDFPDWFKIGCFEMLHKDSLPAAKVYYAKFLYATGAGLASKAFELEGVTGLALMGLLPATIEPMISQAMADSTVIPEIFLRLTCAVTYHYTKNDTQAIRHIDRALALALPDQLYGILAEYCRTIGGLIERQLKPINEQAWCEVNQLSKIHLENWSQLGSRITGQQIIKNLTKQNREIARLAAFKLSDAEIASRMHMSLSGVKQAIRIIKQNSGLDRDDFAAIL